MLLSNETRTITTNFDANISDHNAGDIDPMFMLFKTSKKKRGYRKKRYNPKYSVASKKLLTENVSNGNFNNSQLDSYSSKLKFSTKAINTTSEDSERDEKLNDAIWLSSYCDQILPPRNKFYSANETNYHKSNFHGESQGADIISNAHNQQLLSIDEQSSILDTSLRANGLSKENLDIDAMRCLIDLIRRYTLELLVDANDYTHHVATEMNEHIPEVTLAEITSEDILLAAELRSDDSITSTLPSFHELLAYADYLNNTSLPLIPSSCYNGIVLPPKGNQLTARTFDVVSSGCLSSRINSRNTYNRESPACRKYVNHKGSGVSVLRRSFDKNYDHIYSANQEEIDDSTITSLNFHICDSDLFKNSPTTNGRKNKININLQKDKLKNHEDKCNYRIEGRPLIAKSSQV